MAQSATRVRTDFDRIALLSEQYGWNHNDHYHGFLLRQLPARMGEALDVGCGAGAFSRLLARRSERVLGVDLSPEMVRVARERSRGCPNIEYQVADVLEWDWPTEQFDCVATIATLHHLPLEPVLRKMRSALRPGGVLVVLDLYTGEGLSDLLVSGVAVAANFGLRLRHTGRLREPAELREAWEEHGRHDTYSTLAEIRRVCASLLPGAKVRRHLLWRYSLVWKRPA